jgi:hypothetical protein
VLHEPPVTPVSGSDNQRGQCPECLARFAPLQARQLFCSVEHKAAFHNRATVRGRSLTPLVMAARITRGGSRGDTVTGCKARRDSQQLMDRWAIEDRAAKRMSMTDYVRLRLAKGFELA